MHSPKLPRVSSVKMKIENSKRNNWKHAIFSPRSKKLFKDHYKGQWLNDKKHGKGSKIDRNGWLYEGDWFNGEKHGYGVLSKVLKDGNILKRYAGQWFAGHIHGIGSKWSEDGSYYEGNFLKNKREDYGRIWYKNGDYFQGTWKNDLREGLGLMILACGNRFEGQFVRDKKEGHGVFYYLDTGQRQFGYWKNNYCINGTMEDIDYRQTAVRPTPYPIPENEMVKAFKCWTCTEGYSIEESPLEFKRRISRGRYRELCLPYSTCTRF